MQIRNAKNWSKHSTLEALPFTAACFVLITATLFISGPSFYSVHPYKFYFGAAIFIAYVYGIKFALLLDLVSSVFANFYFVPPFGEFTFTAEELERFFLNLFFGSVAIFLIEGLQRERFKSKLLLMVSESRYLILLHRDNRLLNKLKRNIE